MQHAPMTLPDAPANGVTGGLDWAQDDHAVAVVDSAGRQIQRFAVAHNAAGLRELVAGLATAGVTEVAIERPDGTVVDALLAAGLTVVVISPNQLKNLRGRYGSVGNKDDRFDTYVLADTLRTDRARLRPLTPDSSATTALRSACRARKDLVGHRVALANQLRAHLQQVFPGALGLFADLDSLISLQFLSRFDCQDRADWLSPARLSAWLRRVGYTGGSAPEVLYARLAAAPRGVTGKYGATTAQITCALASALSALVEQIKVLTEQISEQLDTHADAHIFTSLPRSGRVRAARLLTEIGDCRARFPTPEPCSAWPAPHPRPASPQSQGRQLPLGGRQTAARRRLRLRRRQPHGQPVGSHARHRRPGPRPPARGAHPRPRLALRHLALLARRRRLRPSQT